MATGKKPDRPDRKSRAGGVEPDLLPEELDERRRRLEAELAKKGVRKKSSSPEERPDTSAGVAEAMKLSSEFIAGILVGAVIGWVIDRFAGTSPWGLIVFLLLGFGAGVLNILRSMGHVAEGGIQPGRAPGENKKGPQGPDTETPSGRDDRRG
ncbi:AtpZ/AtpI family protein [Phyllobacterium leguminum]|uniref:ATP synthase protein I n=1 Tax=Phyllobacterium leguminum TaxID=314237 RepID=A0A318T635_9HYPH|nr:AtpZ/AtpI family protein [Phyllobacterium leguminum]PYE90549.1 ATP synthase protein I [Phyllobacterium leguminum]